MLALDVVEDILLTQDVKDLLRWKSVCKSWYSLISSPLFVKRHLKFVCNKEEKNNKQLGNRRIDRGCCYSLNIEGSSNGLVCISSIDNYQICLTNPSTREFRILQQPTTLPKSAREFGLESRKYSRCYGFGYDSSADDYKLVMATSHQDSNETLVHILSLKSNVWKLFGRVNYYIYYSRPGILFNGSLHWFWDRNDEYDTTIIMSFDLVKEEFREIPHPEHSDLNSKLGIFENHLCILPVKVGRIRYGIWVMKNYNGKQSWEQLPWDCEMKDRVHFMDEDRRPEMPSYFCDDDAAVCDSGEDMSNPIFVQTLVSPYVNAITRPSAAKNNKRNVKSARHKGTRKILMTREIEGEGGKKKRTRNKNNSER